jgi:hypothetical protein
VRRERAPESCADTPANADDGAFLHALAVVADTGSVLSLLAESMVIVLGRMYVAKYGPYLKA